jgi:hypothetical protein
VADYGARALAIRVKSAELRVKSFESPGARGPNVILKSHEAMQLALENAFLIAVRAEAFRAILRV